MANIKRVRELVHRAIEREGAYPIYGNNTFDGRGGACLLCLCLVGDGKRRADGERGASDPLQGYCVEAAASIGITYREAQELESRYAAWSKSGDALPALQDMYDLGRRLRGDYLLTQEEDRP
jgi:hypothetical protein